MPKRIPQDWESLERELHAAGVTPAEIEAGARRLLAESRVVSSLTPVSSLASPRKTLPRRSR